MSKNYMLSIRVLISFNTHIGDIKNKEDFDKRKMEYEMRDQVDDNKEKPLYSENLFFEEYSFLWYLQQREYDVRNGRYTFKLYIIENLRLYSLDIKSLGQKKKEGKKLVLI